MVLELVSRIGGTREEHYAVFVQRKTLMEYFLVGVKALVHQ